MTQETILGVKIEENLSKIRYNDISTINFWLIEPEQDTLGTYVVTKKVHSFSCFSNHYPVGKEREFIEKILSENVDKYNRVVIRWSDSN